MLDLEQLSRMFRGITVLIFVVYFIDRLSASARVPIDLFSIPALVMFPMLLVMALLVGASFMIESRQAER
jgi:uncharacterized membrane protein YsdA (DUF1294 family)